MGFKTNTEKVMKHYNQRLREMSTQGIAMAAAGTLDNMAFESRKIAIKTFENQRVIRSNWTQRGMLFQKTRRGVPIKKMESRSGNIRPYADTLEGGDTVHAEKDFLPIPALGSRIGKNKRKRIAKRMRFPLKARRMPRIGGSPTRRFAAMMNLARKEKYFGPFLITENDAGSDRLPKGLFSLTGHGRGRRGGGKITMLRKLKRSVRVPGKPYLRPAGIKVGRKMDRTYIRQAKRTLRKYGRDIK